MITDASMGNSRSHGTTNTGSPVVEPVVEPEWSGFDQVLKGPYFLHMFSSRPTTES